MIELPEVREDGMSGRNEQRKPGTTRGSPRRSRTAKASRTSRHAVKSRCAHEWDGWGRLSDDGPGHYNPNPSEDPWGGGVINPRSRWRHPASCDPFRDVPFLEKALCRWWLPGAGLSKGLGEDLATARN